MPEVLRRLFHNRARTLADTITSLSPLSDGGWSYSNSDFLLRPGDPRDYLNLLTRCFVVVSGNAPSLAKAFSYCPPGVWSQHQIVTRTIEFMLCEQSPSSNVLCSNYDKYNHSSPVIEILCRPAWDHLLKRVGACTVGYLLKHGSIFLPLTHKRYHQVAGPPISDLCPKFSENILAADSQNPSIFHSVPWKRKKGDSVATERQPLISIRVIDDPIISASSPCCNGGRRHTLHVGSHCRLKCSCTSSPDVVMFDARSASVNNNEWISTENVQQCSNQIVTNSRKRCRPFRWQRDGKRRQLNFQEAKVPCATVCLNEDSLFGGFQCCFSRLLSLDDAKASWQGSCLLLQDPLKSIKGAEINRQSIFYNTGRSSSVLPRKHILLSLKPNLSSAKFLIRSIFGLSDVDAQAQGEAFCCTGSTCLYHSSLKLFKILIRKARYQNCTLLLYKHCVGQTLDQDADEDMNSIILDNEYSGVMDQQFHALNTSQVVSFIWAACRRIVPADLLGTCSNWRILRRNIFKFVKLQRFERFSLQQCLFNLRATAFPFLLNKHSAFYPRNHAQNERMLPGNFNYCTHVLKQEILERWIYWFFSYLVVPLVQTNFYVTESEHGKKRVYYYWKPIWEKLKGKAVSNLKCLSYRSLDAASVVEIIRHRSFGFSRLRFRPKENGVRVLANLKAPSRVSPQLLSANYQSAGLEEKLQFHHGVKSYYMKSVNSVLRDLHVVLKGLQSKKPENLGSSVFNYDEVYRKFCPFVIGLKKITDRLPDVFIVVSDVRKAFDSVNQDLLLSIMKDVIFEDNYLLNKSRQVICSKRFLAVNDSLILHDQSFSSYENATFGSHSLHGILVNQGQSKIVRKEMLCSILKEHVKHNVLQLDGSFYLQNVGIPQGSVLSSQLCSFYYGSLEKNVIFPFLEKAWESTENLRGKYTALDTSATWHSETNTRSTSTTEYMLLRFVDDFLLISTSKKQAAGFLSRLQRGFREYNCYMNEDKVSHNFYFNDMSKFPSNKVYVGTDGIAFLRWSGLLINCCTLEVQADYTSYLNNHICSTLTIHWQGEPVDHLRSRLCGFMRPKCHPLFFDSNINSAGVVRLNVYQAFLLCAMKFHCYTHDMSTVCNICPSAYLDIISRTIRYKYRLIKKTVFKLSRGSNLCPILHLGEVEVEWLGLNAFIKVLKKKESRHKRLLSLLRLKLLSVNGKVGSVSFPLTYAVDASHSSLFWEIKY